MRIRSIIASSLILASLHFGCNQTEPVLADRKSPEPASPALAVYDRTARRFPRAIFYKPGSYSPDHPLADVLSVDLMPLIVQETPVRPPGGAEPPDPRILGHMTAPGRAGGDDRPAVYAGFETAVIQGREYLQVVCWWRRTVPSAAGQYSTHVLNEGVRLTLNDDGLPMIWEALGGPSGLRLIYVARRLEDAAANQYGPPLPGRRFSTEADRRAAPSVVVPRVLDEAPTAMGPFVYLSREGGATTLLCRCMASQADEFVATVEYQVRPLDEAEGWSNAADQEAPQSLESVLRLPSLKVGATRRPE